jgi:hypothetical protein
MDTFATFKREPVARFRGIRCALGETISSPEDTSMRPPSPARAVSIGAVIAASITACTDANNIITEPTGPIPTVSSMHASASVGDVVNVADVEQLYAAINDPANQGAMLLLAPGTYVLSAKNASGANRPNAGRLELQRDMSVSGVAGDRAAVVIDAAGLPQSSFTMPFGRTGVFRTGHGRTAIEWLTIAGNPLAAAAIETELVSTPEAQVRVAHVLAGNSARGVDVRNVGAPMAGRRLHAEIIDSEFFRGVEGIRVANFIGADRGDISVVMSGNRSYENVLGCIVESNRSSFGTIYVRSSGDRFEDNGLGCQIGAGLASSGVANSNTTVFDCHGSHFSNNTRTEFFNNTGPDFQDFGGVLVAAGDVIATGGVVATTSSNTVVMRLWGCKAQGNQHFDFEAYGARSREPSTIAGVDNHTTIELQGVSKRIDVLSVNSSPVDPSGSNTATVIR